MDDKQTPISTLGFLGIILLSLIPIVGLIVLLIWSFGGTSKVNKKNFSRALLIVSALSIIVFAGAASAANQYINTAILGNAITQDSGDIQEKPAQISSNDIVSAINDNPQLVALLLKNPAVISEITNLLSNPEILSGIMNNPEVVNQLINNPDIQNALLNNPEAIKHMLNNPEVQSALLNNPEVISSILNNPDIMSAILTPEVLAGIINSGAFTPNLGNLFGNK